MLGAGGGDPAGGKLAQGAAVIDLHWSRSTLLCTGSSATAHYETDVQNRADVLRASVITMIVHGNLALFVCNSLIQLCWLPL